MVKKGQHLTQAHKDAISLGMKEYYRTHEGPWKWVKRNEDFKNSVSKTLRRTYENGHNEWNKGKSLLTGARQRSIQVNSFYEQ